MTDDQKDRLLGDCLEDYHRKKARGEVPPLASYREQLGDLFEDFQELVAAETLIDEALDAGQDDPLPRTWGEYTLLSVLGRGGAGVIHQENKPEDYGRDVGVGGGGDDRRQLLVAAGAGDRDVRR